MWILHTVKTDWSVLIDKIYTIQLRLSNFIQAPFGHDIAIVIVSVAAKNQLYQIGP